MMGERMNAIENAMSFLYRDETITNKGYDVLRQNGYDVTQIDARFAQKNQARAAGSAYARLVNGRHGMMDNLVQTRINWNDYPLLRRSISEQAPAKDFALHSFAELKNKLSDHNIFARGVMLMDPQNAEASLASLQWILSVIERSYSLEDIGTEEEAGTKLVTNTAVREQVFREMCQMTGDVVQRIFDFDLAQLDKRVNESEAEYAQRVLPLQDDVLTLVLPTMMLSDMMKSKMEGDRPTVRQYLFAGNEDLMKYYDTVFSRLNCAYQVIRGFAMMKAVDLKVFNREEMLVTSDRSKLAWSNGEEGKTDQEKREGISHTFFGSTKTKIPTLQTPSRPPVANPGNVFRQNRPAQDAPIGH